MRHRVSARAPRPGSAPAVQRDPAIVGAFLSDAAHVPGGTATGVVFPSSGDEVAALVGRADALLPIGAQSSLTGGATPRGDVVVSTRALDTIGVATGHRVRVGAGVPVMALQQALAAAGLYYPPVPTFEGAFVGGTIATNAAGAATFKYGATRAWVDAITVVLADGSILDLARGTCVASSDGRFEIVLASGRTAVVPVPTYTMPRVAKLSAGYYAAPAMDLVDLFVGAEGTLGIIVDATLRVRTLPRRRAVLVGCRDDAQAIAVTTALRDAASAAWAGRGALDVAAIEYMDARALRVVPQSTRELAGWSTDDRDAALLLVQLEAAGDDDGELPALQELLDSCGVSSDPVVTAVGDVRGMQRLFDLREAVPSGVNAMVAAARRSDPRIEKTAGDPVVPFERIAESLALYRREFAAAGLDYAIWGHLSDGNLHPNVIPRTWEDVERGREALLRIAHGVVALGGAPLAEHGVGRSPLKQRLLRELYGSEGIEQMRAVKRALDPEWKLAPGVLFPKNAIEPA